MSNEPVDTGAFGRIRLLIWVVIIGLVVSGATAIPLETELKVLARVIDANPGDSGFAGWVLRIRDALIDTNDKYPFLAYGTDWLAFAHFVIAIAFIGPLRDPVKNIWVIEFGMIAAALIIPYALIMGMFREIPLGWRLIDSSFGVLAFLLLWVAWRQIKQAQVKP
jgi:hypothetical protein